MENLTTSNDEEATSKPSVIERLLEDARKRLVETGTRNRLIHVNLENRRANALPIENERSDDIYDILKTKSRKMRFKALGNDEPEDDSDTPLLAIDLAEEPFNEARYTDSFIETPLNTDKMQKRLLRLARDAKTAEEEQGVNILYLALGFLTWYEDKKSAVKRQAPLILLPVSLERNSRTSTYDIVCRDDDLVTNLPLQERLKEDFGIQLPEIEEAEDWSPSKYFDLIRPMIADRSNWSLEQNAQQLGFFSFAKLLMLRDLDPSNWPNDRLVDHSLLKGVLVDGFETDSPLFADDDKLDKLLEPHDIIQVVDADASQTKVIEEVRAGRSLVVQGPPGTGKSQTITNIIAAAVHDGKTVLFVAEKMAALSVVYQRLVKCELRDVCLELHSKSANKKTVLAELGRTLNAGRSVPNLPSPPDDLKRKRDTLNNITSLLHKRIPDRDFSAFSAMSKIVGFIGQNAPAPSININDLANLSNKEAERLTTTISTYSDLVSRFGSSKDHPFRGTGNLSLSPTDLQRLSAHIQELMECCSDFETARIEATMQTQLKSPETAYELEEFAQTLEALAQAPEATGDHLRMIGSSDKGLRLVESLTIAADWKQAKADAESTIRGDCWDALLNEHRGAILAGTTSFFTRLGPKYRKASKALQDVLVGALPKGAEARLVIFDQFLEVQRQRRMLDDEEPFLKSILNEDWRGERTPFSNMKDVAVWFNDLSQHPFSPQLSIIETCIKDAKKLRTLASNVKDSHHRLLEQLTGIEQSLSLNIAEAIGAQTLMVGSFTSIKQWGERLEGSIERYSEWVSLVNAAGQLEKHQLKKLVTLIDEGNITPESAVTEFNYARAEAQWNEARLTYPQIDKLSNYPRHKLVEDFQQQETSRIVDTQRLILAKHLEQLPSGSVGEMAYIRGEIARKRGHKSIRKLIENAGSMVQKIKPVFLMSPISIAQFLPPGKMQFDLLVIDEASQVKPEDALGAIVRANQIVVVGDQKQLPPTSFFDRMTGNNDSDNEDDELLGATAKATDLESILTACEAKGLRSRMLEWHYRSRDPSLIQVSNAEFYNNALVLPPSPLQNDENYGFKFVRVAGAYTSASKGAGRPGTNKIEAQAIVDAVARHARDWPELSLGIVAFSVRQRNMLNELLEHARRQDEILDQFLREGKCEDVFVKNIENVQGDERDVIFISVGYGPNEPNGRLATMSFGPINGEGGERRLNVLFSRSRVRCEVFASFDPGDIDLGRTKKDGPRVLKRFLDFAKTRQMDEKVPTGLLADSPFEADVAEQIRKFGYTVDHQVGSGGFRIDLGVKHPERVGQYMLAVECDGATYHSALWARERDRLRQAVLEGLGWDFYRIWSTDWFHRRSQEIERLRLALVEAEHQHSDGVTVSGANEGYEHSEMPDNYTPQSEVIDIPEIDISSYKAPAYRRASFTLNTSMEPHEISAGQLVPIVQRIIEDEGPIHTDETARRLASAFGKQKAGGRIQDSTVQALNLLLAKNENDEFIGTDNFWYTKAQKEQTPIRDRSEESGSLIKAEMLPPIEVLAAAKKITDESGHVDEDQLIKAIGNLLGYKRVGPELKERIGEILRYESHNGDAS